MTAALAIAKPFIELLLAAFGKVLLDMFTTWQGQQDAIARGRAEAAADGALAALRAQQAMDAVPLPDEDEALARLKAGTA